MVSQFEADLSSVFRPRNLAGFMSLTLCSKAQLQQEAEQSCHLLSPASSPVSPEQHVRYCDFHTPADEAPHSHRHHIRLFRELKTPSTQFVDLRMRKV